MGYNPCLMVASALVTAAGLAYVGRRYFYKKARKGLREIEIR